MELEHWLGRLEAVRLSHTQTYEEPSWADLIEGSNA